VTTVACTPSPVTSPTLSPPSSPTSTSSRPPVVSSARPAARPSYGLNGTHFPEDTPWPGEEAAHELVAECDWVDIARKVSGLSSAEVAAGAVVRVKPGTLPGGGSKSSSPVALGNVGNQAWTRNVLIVPLEGFGSVTVSDAGIRIDQSARISLFGFVSAGGFTLTRCVDIEMGWSRWSGGGITRGARNVGFYELVLGFRQDSNDTIGYRPIETYEMTGLTRYGCVFGPSVKPADSGAHCDTVQLEGTGTGVFGGFTSVDCVDYGSSNAAFVMHTDLTFADFQHCLVLAGQLPWQVYPLRPGDYEGDPNAFAGGCQDVRLSDSVVSGAVGKIGFTTVTDTSLSYAPTASQGPTVSGSWTVDTGIPGWGRDKIMSLQEVPDYEIPTLRSLWVW
jgi:hypothetical protein